MPALVTWPTRRAGRFGAWCPLWLLLLVLWAPAAGAAGRIDTEALRGLPLAEALLRFADASGLEIVFSETLVRPEMQVAEPPAASDPRTAIAQLLAPHGLTTRPGPGGRLVVVRAPIIPGRIVGVVHDRLSGEALPGVTVRVPGTPIEARTDAAGAFELPEVPPGWHSLEAWLAGFSPGRLEDLLVPPDGTAEASLTLQIVAVDEIVITPSRLTVTRDEPIAALQLDADRLLDLPVFGSDFVRAAALLPGAASNDFSARFSLRGGRPDEVLVRLDGLELLEPYHLKDYESAISIVAPETVGRMDLISGGFPASFGDRMSGVLDMTSREPGTHRQTYLSLSLIDAEAGGASRFHDRGAWMASARQSVLNVVADALESDEDPTYWDAFVKLGFDLSPRQTLSARWLASDDHLNLTELSATGTTSVATTYSSTYGWLRHEAVADPRLLFETTLFVGKVERDRSGEHSGPLTTFEVLDERELDIDGVEHQGRWMPSRDGLLHWGASARSLETGYDYLNRIATSPEGLQSPPTVALRDRFEGRQLGAFVSYRQRPVEALTAELGVRFDENEILDERHLSPRLNLAWAIHRQGVLRAAWGRFYQSQRAYELQVEDGESGFFPDERSTQAVLGYEHSFGNGAWFRGEIQRRTIKRPRVRYENLLDPVSRFPEVEPDRIRLAPERARSESLELLLRHNRPARSWWVSYVLSRVEDRFDGRWVPRSLDQTHAVVANLDRRLGPAWNLSLTGRFHTGWPYTPFTVEAATGEPSPRLGLGPLYSARFDDYTRVDLRLARSWDRGPRRLRIYLDVLNVLNSTNPRGFELTPGAGAAGDIGATQQAWLSRVANFGVKLEF